MQRAMGFPLANQVPVPASHWDGQAAVDLFAAEGTPWTAVFDGVAQPLDVPLGGYALLLTAPDGTVAYYAHGLAERASGQVRAGGVIGYVSDSGNARGTGHHLHFAVGSSIDSNGAGTVAPHLWLAGAAAAGGGSGGALPGELELSNLARAALVVAGAVILIELIGG